MKIRPANHEDSTGIAKIQVDSYLTTYAEIFPAEYLEHFTYAEQEQDWRDWIATKQQPLYVSVTAENEVVGYALGAHNLEEVQPYESELIALHVGKAYRRKGLGRRLFAAVSQALAAQGSNSLSLWVLAENPACGFYEKLGGQYVRAKAWRNNTYFGTSISEVAYGWLDISVLYDRE